MKTTNILYWVFTGIFTAVMLMSGVVGLMHTPEALAGMKHFGYPPYFNNLLGIAKVLGVIALLYPGFPRLKEWAYAGFAIDMVSAVYSTIAVGDPAGKWAPIFIFIAIFACSYIFYHKKLKAKAGQVV
jgi:uncharacterized membrane protein YphA (DoxX/SURF4 family)